MILLAWWLCNAPWAGSADLFNSIKPVRKVNLSPDLKDSCSKVSLTLANNHSLTFLWLWLLSKLLSGTKRRGWEEKPASQQQRILSVLRRDNTIKQHKHRCCPLCLLC